MDHFDPVETLALIQRHRVTHVQFVPTHMVRLLKLAGRGAGPVRPLQPRVRHPRRRAVPPGREAGLHRVGRARSCTSTTRAARAWASASSGPRTGSPTPARSASRCSAPSTSSPPTAPSSGPARRARCASRPASRFEYHGDPEKTAAACNDRGWSSLGDMGWIDEDGYLYLTDRVSQHDHLGRRQHLPPRDRGRAHRPPRHHRRRGDRRAATRTWARRCGPIVQPAGPVDDDAASPRSSSTYCRERLTHFKCPTSVALVGTLPRLQTGKISKRLFDDWLRQPFPDGVIVETDLSDA